MENFVTSKVIGKEQSNFVLIMDVSLHYKAFVMFPNQSTISSLRALHGERFNLSSEGDLMKVSKDA